MLTFCPLDEIYEGKENNKQTACRRPDTHSQRAHVRHRPQNTNIRITNVYIIVYPSVPLGGIIKQNENALSETNIVCKHNTSTSNITMTWWKMEKRQKILI